ncbi:hypothetical protein BDQ12DRAFT_664286 [Crucibulum laeve]|uniref:Uncharacterized protein n=1 Tax=Crucibulum laeve TaxID=68775 RepID=A0A5C3MHB3_9AGAR|nr:hypothetical protein BDQ12DRAFT_664286 [Crucibulum laeve]
MYLMIKNHLWPRNRGSAGNKVSCKEDVGKANPNWRNWRCITGKSEIKSAETYSGSGNVLNYSEHTRMVVMGRDEGLDIRKYAVGNMYRNSRTAAVEWISAGSNQSQTPGYAMDRKGVTEFTNLDTTICEHAESVICFNVKVKFITVRRAEPYACLVSLDVNDRRVEWLCRIPDPQSVTRLGPEHKILEITDSTGEQKWKKPMASTTVYVSAREREEVAEVDRNIDKSTGRFY